MEINLSKALKAKGMTQAALADAVGISRGFLSEINSGKKSPSVETLQKIAEVLEVPLDAIYSSGNAPTGLAEAATRYEPANSTDEAIKRLFSKGGAKIELYLMKAASPMLLLAKGDILAVDISRKPEPTESVIISELDDTGGATTHVARWLDPWVEFGDSTRPAETIGDNGQIAIMGVIVGSFRG